MAADWIKMRTDLYRDPKVCAIADDLMDDKGDLARYVNQNMQCDMSVTRNVTRNAVVGALLSVWGVMRHRGRRVDDDLLLRGMTLLVIDDVADLPGFGEAMASVEWVVETDEGIVFPHFFEEHNVEPEASGRSKSAERQARYRERKAQESNVTRDVTRDVTLRPREREEKEIKAIEPPISPTGGKDGGKESRSDEVQPVVDAYHRALPKCQRITVLNAKRRKRILSVVKIAKGLCKSWQCAYDGADFFTRYFEECAKDPWMRGEVANPRNPSWKQNLDVLLAEDRFAKVLDAAFDGQGETA